MLRSGHRLTHRLPVDDHRARIDEAPVTAPIRSSLAGVRIDGDIRSDVVEGIVRGSMWLDPSTFDIEVEDGAVRIHGEVDRRSEVEIMINLILGVDGVIDVDAALTYRFDDRNITPAKELGGI